MATSYVGEIRMFGGNFPPIGWAFCNGQLLSIAEYSVLFNLIGTTYGGNGTTNFALPNLQGRVPIHAGSGSGGTHVQGQMGGEETVTLTANQIPQHTHTASANAGAGTDPGPAGNVWAGSTNNPYATASAIDTQMAPGALGPAGGSLPHDNMIPFLAVNFIISLFGVFPSQN
jgi:microcystin-dependent protein